MKFNFYFDDDILLIKPFELGDIDIIIKNEKITSKNRIPDQSLMLLISISDLMDGIRKFDAMKKYTFIGADSSFKFLVRKIDKNLIQIDVDKKSFTIKYIVFIKAIWEGYCCFRVKYLKRIIPSNPDLFDLRYSENAFSSHFKKILNI